MTAPCPGACNAAWRATGEGDPWLGDPVWCHRDAARIRRQLGKLDILACALAYHGDGYYAQSRDPARNGQAPSPSPAADDIDLLQNFLTEWEDAYRDWYNRAHPGRPWLTRPDFEDLIAVIPGTICWLTRYLDGILASPMAADFGLEIGQKYREFIGKTRAGTGMHLGLVPCAHCKLRLLAWADGDDHLRCGNCGRWMSMDDYHDAVNGETARQLEDAS